MVRNTKDDPDDVEETEVDPELVKVDYRDEAVERVLSYWRCRVLRMAVLRSALGRKIRETGKTVAENEAAALSAMRALRELWRVRAEQLWHERWERITDKYHLNYMANCPSFGVKFRGGRRTRPCGKTPVCPFCYARRYVAVAYEFFEDYLYGARDAGPKVKRISSDLSLIEYRSAFSHRWAESDSIYNDIWMARVARDSVAPYIQRRRREDIDRIPGYIVGMVFHRPEALDGRIRVKRTTLAVTASHKTIDKKWDTDKIFVYPKITKAVLARVVSRAMAYPRSWLFQPASVVAAIFNQLKGAHLLSTYGRGNAEKGFGLDGTVSS